MAKQLLVLLVFVSIVYTGVQFGSPFFHYYTFKADVEELVSVVDPRTQRRKVMERVIRLANEYNVPIEERDIILTRSRKRKYEVKTSWEETVNFLDIYKKTFEFSVDTSK